MRAHFLYDWTNAFLHLLPMKFRPTLTPISTALLVIGLLPVPLTPT